MRSILRTLCLVLGVAFCAGTAYAGVYFIQQRDDNSFFQQQYEGATDCAASFNQTCDSPYVGTGQACGGRYESCQCDASYDKTCTYPNVGSGIDCEGKYQDCACPSTFTQTCTSPKIGTGSACGGKYESCVCPSTYNKTCSAPNVGVGLACDGKYESCQCPVGTYVTCPGGGDVGAQSCTDSGGTKYTACLVACPSGYSTSYSSISSCPNTSGYNFVSSGTSGGQICGKCNVKGCSSGVLTCGSGYDYQTNGYYSGTSPCYNCTPKACPAGYSTTTSSCSTGYTLTSNGWSGITPCRGCTATGCASGYSTSTTYCSTGYMIESNGVSGALACNKCVVAPCPDGYSTTVTSSNCSSTNGYTIVANGKSGTLACNRCDIKSCPTGYDTTITSVADCPVSGSAGWNLASSGKSDNKTCYKCNAVACLPGYSTAYSSISSCNNPLGYVFDSAGYSGESVCGKCTANKCPSGSSITKTCSTADGWEYDVVTDYAGNNECKKCVATPCPDGSSTAAKTCSSPAESSVYKGMSGGDYCTKCECTATRTNCNPSEVNLNDKTYEVTGSCQRNGTTYVACGACNRTGGTAEGYASCIWHGGPGISTYAIPYNPKIMCNGVQYYQSCTCQRPNWAPWKGNNCGPAGYPSSGSGHKTYVKAGLDYTKYYHRGYLYNDCWDAKGIVTYNGCVLYHCGAGKFDSHKVIKDTKTGRFAVNSDEICCPTGYSLSGKTDADIVANCWRADSTGAFPDDETGVFTSIQYVQ